VIRDSSATSLAGGVAVGAKASFTMTRGALSANTSATAGGLYLQQGGTATITATTIDKNKASAGDGGGLFVSGALTMTGATVTNNTAALVSGNNQTGTGGGLYVGKTATTDTPSATVDSSTFRANTAWLGGGIGVNSGSALTLRNGSTLDHNTATNSGAGIYNAGTATVRDTAIAAGTAPGAAAGIYDGSVLAADTPSLTLTDSTVSGGTAVLAGGIAIAAKASLTASGGAVAGNTATNAGGVYLQEGATATLDGTAVRDNAAQGGNGGGVWNAGTLTVRHALVSGNSAVPASNGSNGVGGAVYANSGQQGVVVSTRLDADTFTGNHASAGSAVVTAGSAVISRSTVHANAASPGAGSVVSFGAMALVADTITDNSAATGSGGIYTFTTTTAIAGSIVAGNSGANCNTALADGGYNLINAADASCGFTAATHDVVAAPHLGALADNGGPTPTRLPAADSAAINAIPAGTTTPLTDPISGAPIALCDPSGTDQRAVGRPQGASCDIGSVEVANTAPTITAPDTVTFLVGHTGSATVTTTGVPIAHLSSSGALPDGITFTDNGDGTATLAGTPAAGTGGQYSVHVTATNGTDPAAEAAITVIVDEPPTVVGSTNATFVVGQVGSVAFGSTGYPTSTLTLDGALPVGVTFTDNGNGTASLSGTPGSGTVGSYLVTITAANGIDPAGTLSFTLTVLPPLQVTTMSLPDGQYGVAYSAGVAARYGSAPYTWSVTAGALPAGLTLNADGSISGTPSAVGSFTFTATAHDSGVPQQQASQQLTLTIGRGPTSLAVDPVLLSLNPLRLTIGTVSATLTGGSPAVPVSGQTVVFKAGPATVCTGVTSSDGRVTCVLSPLNTALVIAALRVTASYAGSATWLPSSGRGNL
jgi:hypothetical protein